MPQRILSESEFNAIRDQVLSSLPDGLSEADFNRLAPSVLAQAVGEAESSPEPMTGSAAGRFASGVGSMLNPIAMVKGLASAVTHPVQTLEHIGAASVDQLRQARTAAGEGRYLEAAGHVAGSIPLIGPAAVEAGEQIASGDVAGGLGKGVGMLAPVAAGSAIRTAGKAAGIIPKSTREIVRSRLDKLAQERVTDVMAPKVGANKVRFGGMAEKVAPAVAKDLANEGAPWTREGLHSRISQKLAEAEAELDAAADARPASAQVPTGPILAKLDQRIKELTAEPVEASRRIPSVTGEAVRQVPIDPLQHYALRWIKDEMESFPFVKRTFNEIPKGKGSTMEVVPGAAGAPIYRAIVGEEGREVIKAGRSDVVKALDDLLAGKKTNSRLQQLILGVADDLVENRPRTIRKLNTPGPVWEQPPDAFTVTMKGKRAEFPAREGRPMGEAVEPQGFADEIETLRQVRNEIKSLGPVARYESVRRIRQGWDQVAKQKYMPSTTQDALKSQGTQTAAMKGAGAIRDALASVDPRTAAANSKYSLYRKAEDVLKATAEVERTRPKVGRQIMARMTGTVAGQQAAGVPGAVAGYLLGPVIDAAVSSGVTTQLKTAALLTKLSEAIRKGDVGYVNSLTAQLKRLGAQGATLAGRSTTPSESQSQTTAPVVP